MSTPNESVSKPRTDGQKTGLAGEFFVAAELLKRGLQTSLTLGNAKAIDLFVINEKGTQFTVQVKASRNRNNYFLIDSRKIKGGACIYVFVVLNKVGIAPDFFIVPGDELSSTPDKFGKEFQNPKMPGIHPRDLAEYRDNWQLFD